MDTAIRTVEVLIEALNHIRNFRDQITVIKLGGSAMEEADALRATLQSVVALQTIGLRPILVHGGGKPIDRAMKASGLEPKKVLGRRYTDEATLEIVVHVLTQEINADILNQIRELGGRPIGMHTASLQTLFGETLFLKGSQGESIDLGRVGEVKRVDSQLLRDLTAVGLIPVIPSLAYDLHGQWLNVNADTAAAAVAAELRASKLLLLTDTPGILRDRNDPKSLLSSLTISQCHELIAKGVIDSGMIPKVEACIDCLRSGVGKVHIIDGRVRHSLLLEIFTDLGIGTEMIPDSRLVS